MRDTTVKPVRETSREMEVGEESMDLPERIELVSDRAEPVPKATSLVRATIFSIYDAASAES